jgi:hypothetical protein
MKFCCQNKRPFSPPPTGTYRPHPTGEITGNAARIWRFQKRECNLGTKIPLVKMHPLNPMHIQPDSFQVELRLFLLDGEKGQKNKN